MQLRMQAAPTSFRPLARVPRPSSPQKGSNQSRQQTSARSAVRARSGASASGGLRESKDALHARHNHGDTDRAERRLNDRRLAVSTHQDPYVPRPHRPLPALSLRPSSYEGRSRLEQTSRRRPRGPRPRTSRPSPFGSGLCRSVRSRTSLRGHEAGPQRRGDRRALEARLLMGLRGVGRPVRRSRGGRDGAGGTRRHKRREGPASERQFSSRVKRCSGSASRAASRYA